MNQYPFEVTGFLAPPPPPPPLPTLQAPSAVHNTNTETDAIHRTQNFVQPHGYDQHQRQHPEALGTNNRHFSRDQSNARPQEMSQNFAKNVVDGLLMLPHDQLRLPPPPPPPLPPCESQNFIRNGSNVPAQREMYTSENRRAVPNARKRPYSSAPPSWSVSKQAPSGLQGPWKSSDSSEFDSRIDEFVEGNSEHMPMPSGFIGADDNFIVSSPAKPPGPTMTAAATTYKDHKVDPKEPGLPKELTILFEALHCKLCEVSSSSNVQAKLHYSGKPHEKKVRQWLMNWSEKTGLPLPKRQKVEAKTSTNPEDLYCNICDVQFSSLKHGEQHKMGKAHQKALRQGFSSAKRKPKPVDVPVDPSGRFGIGEAFCKDKSVDTEPSLTQPLTDVGTPSIAQTPPSTAASSKYFCDLCKVSATAQEHLDAHYAGAKHRKALANSAKNCAPNPETSVVPPPVEPSESILASVINDNDANLLKTRGISNDLSIYRTPSGQFYCHPCNTTTNSEKTFREHTESKRHKYKVASSKRS